MSPGELLESRLAEGVVVSTVKATQPGDAASERTPEARKDATR